MRFVVALAIVVASARAAAHVAPAAGDNNRYLKLTALGDRVRLAYTVFYGQVPGAALRRTIDADRDGTLDAAEADAFGAGVARQVAAAVDLTLDGVRQPVTWSQVVVGLGTPEVSAGAFSIDLVAWFCLAAPRGPHALRLRDSFPLERPGETEVKAEASPGVTIGTTRIGGAEDEAHEYKLVGPSGALETEGLELPFTVTAQAPVSSDAICRRAAPARDRPWWLGAAALGVLALAAVAWRRSRA